jgi:hypothetical protein
MSRKSRSAGEKQRSENRVLNWGRKKIRKFWNAVIRNTENTGDEVAVAKAKAKYRIEREKVENKVERLESKKKAKRVALISTSEFYRYQKYMKKCQRIKEKLEKKAKLFNTFSRTVAPFVLNRKYDFHKSEFNRCKKILFGDLTG